MEQGQLLRLIPFRSSRSKLTDFNSRSNRDVYNAVFTEDVKFLKMSWTGNAIILDTQGNIRYCNPADLTAVFD